MTKPGGQGWVIPYLGFQPMVFFFLTLCLKSSYERIDDLSERIRNMEVKQSDSKFT